MDAITTSSAPEITELRSLEELDAAVVGHFLDLDQCLKDYRRHGLSGTEIGKRVRNLGATISDSQVRRRLQSFSMPKPQSDNPKAVQKRKERERAAATNAHHAQMSHPTTTIQPESTSNVIPFHPSPTPQQHCVPADDPSTVIYPDVLPAVLDHEQQQGHADYLEASRLINQLATVFERNAFQSRMLPEHWRSLHGGLRGLVETAESQTRYSARVLEG
jgi:hypothetical protein